MPRPDECRYTETHEWVRLEADEATVGITDFAVESLTDLTFLELPAVGDRVDQGSPFGEIESVKAAEDLISPVSGEVVAAHEVLLDDLDRIMESPFDEGWMIRVRIDDPAELDDLMDVADYDRHVAEQ